MALSTTETIGLNNQFVQLLEGNKADLQAKGLDVSNWITELKDVNGDTVASDAAQDVFESRAQDENGGNSGFS